MHLAQYRSAVGHPAQLQNIFLNDQESLEDIVTPNLSVKTHHRAFSNERLLLKYV